jgi:hypothetical protein
MNFVRNKKGVVRVIESIIATVLLMSCLALIPAQQPIAKSAPDLASTGQNVLLSLDSNGNLASLISKADWASLQSSLESALPLTAWFNLTVFDNNMNPLNSYPIGDAGSSSGKIVSIDYVCANPSSNFTIYILRLQLSEVGAT